MVIRSSEMMQIILFITLLMATSVVRCQLWSDPSSGIVVKTLYLPLRKGNSAMSLQELNRNPQFKGFNIPYVPIKINNDLQQASTLNQNYSPKVKFYASNAQPIQDVTPKTNNHHKPELQSQVSNLHSSYQISSFPQQHYNTILQPASGSPINHNAEVQQPYYQPQHVSNYMSVPPQSVAHQNNYSNTQHHGNGLNENSVQDVHTSTGGVVQNIHGQTDFGQQVYPSGNFVTQKYTVSNIANTEVHNGQNNQAPSIQYVSSPNHESVTNSQSPQTTFSGESSRFLHPMQSQGNPTHPTTYITSSTQRPSYISSHHQMGYAVQNPPGTQHIEPNIISNNQYSIPQSQENRNSMPSQNQQLQQQSPVSTYAIVHQRIANNNFVPHDNRAVFQAEQNRVSNLKQTSEGLSASVQTSYANNGPPEYIKPTANQDMAFQISGEVPQNYADNSQYVVKHEVPGTISSQQNNGYPATAQVQIMAQHYPSQHDSQEGQYFNQQSTASSFPVVQSHSSKPRVPQQQNSAPQVSYPDPSSETFYPENKQVYLAPPPNYSSQVQQQQQQSVSHQNFVRYPSQSEASSHYSQIPVSVQTEQLGIHISVPNRNFA